MRSDVLAGGRHGRGGPRQRPAVHLKHMPEAVVDVEANLGTLSARPGRQPFGVVQQDFVTTDLDQHRWQAAQVAEYWRQQGGVEGVVAGIETRGMAGPFRLQDRFAGRRVEPALGQVGPG